MRIFKNPKAKELIEKANNIEEEARRLCEEGEKSGSLGYIYLVPDLLTEAAGLRVQADDIEDGIDRDDGDER